MKEKILKKLNFGNVKKNVSWILFQNVYSMLLSLIFTGIIARYYGTEGYGIINFCSSFVALFSFIAIFGTNHIIVNDLVEKKNDVGKVLGSNLFIRIILAVLALIISQTIALLMYDKVTNIVILLFSINTIISASDVIAYYAQAKIENKYISIAKVISVTVFSVLKLLAVIFKVNITMYVITYIIENIVYTILLIVSYKKIKKEEVIKWSIDKEYIFKLLQRGKYFALSALMVTIYMRIDQVMIGTFFSNKSMVGIYSAAVRISEIWTFVPISVITSFKPIVISSKDVDEKGYINNLQKLYNIVSLICLVFVIGIIVFGKLGIYILYGKDFMDAYLPLLILVISVWIGSLGNVHYIWITCEKKEKYSLVYSAVGCVTNIILNLLLIPKYGLIGAAIATLVSQISSNILSFLLIKDARIISYMLLKSLNPIYGIKGLLNNKEK